MNVQSLVGPQLRSLADALEGSDPDAPSLCQGWQVRHVVAHLTMAARYDEQAFGAELAAVGFDFAALSETVARRDAARDWPSLLADLRSDVLAGFAMPGGGALGALTHAVIHGLDITVALGLPRTSDDAAVRLVLDALVVDPSPFGIGLDGWHLQATDLDWEHGTGTTVAAPAEELVLALANRPRGLPLRAG